MNKPLSETHPTLFSRIEKGGQIFSVDVQKFTVDLAEHDLIRNAYEIEQEERIKSDADVERLRVECEFHLQDLVRCQGEVERLKRELGEQSLQWAEHCNKAYLKGERRAMERLKKELEENKDALLFRENSGFTKGLVKGLAEGERRAMERVRIAFWNNIKEISTYHSATKIFILLFRQHPKELGLGEEVKQ